MIEKQGRRQTLLCDSCEEPLDRMFEADEFADMVEHAKSERWLIRQEDGSWRHYCNDCRDDLTGGALARQRRLFGL